MKDRNKIKIAITGSTGVLGNHFCLKYKNYFRFYKFKGDITKKNHLNNWLNNIDPEIFLHFAAIVPLQKVNRDTRLSKRVNIDSIQYIMRLLSKKKQLKWFFFSSTSHVYKKNYKKIKESSKIEPTSKYGSQKLQAEIKILNLQKKLNFKVCIGRIFSFTNYDQDNSFLIPGLFKKIVISDVKKIDINEAKRDFIHIDDICEAINVLLINKYSGIYNIGSGRSYKISYVAKFFKKKFKKKIMLHIKKTTKNDCLLSDNKKLKKTGWKPKRDLNEILNEYIKLNHDKVLESDRFKGKN